MRYHIAECWERPRPVVVAFGCRERDFLSLLSSLSMEEEASYNDVVSVGMGSSSCRPDSSFSRDDISSSMVGVMGGEMGGA